MYIMTVRSHGNKMRTTYVIIIFLVAILKKTKSEIIFNNICTQPHISKVLFQYYYSILFQYKKIMEVFYILFTLNL